MATIKATLKDIKKNNVIYPQTSADNVYSIDGTTVEKKLTNFANYLSSLSMAFDYKGYFPTESVLLSRYPNNIEYPDSREGWYARVGSEGESDTTMYYWDVEGNTWVKGSSVEITGITTVNGIQPNEDGNVTITAEDIPTSFLDEQGKQKSTQDVFNMLQGEHLDLSSDIDNLSSNIDNLSTDVGNLSNSINDLEDEISVVNDKSTVLYLTNEEMVEAISSLQLLERYDAGQVVVCNDEGDYKLGSSYKYTIGGTEENPTFSWEEITSSVDTTNLQSETVTLYNTISVPKVSYINLSSNPFVLESDGYYHSTNTANYSTSLMAIVFNFSEPQTITFDGSVEGSTTTMETLFFSNLDAALESNYSSTKNVKTLIDYTTNPNIQVSYDVPAGEHTIYIRFSKHYGQSAAGMFKLTSDVSGDLYVTKSNVLKTSDSGTLLSNDYEVLTSENSVTIVKGTDIAPVILNELAGGKLYILSGLFKYSSADTRISKVTSDTSSSAEPNGSVLLFVGEYNTSFGTPITILGGTFLTDTNDILLSNYYNREGNIAFCGFISDNGQVAGEGMPTRYFMTDLRGQRGGTVLITNNAVEYSPTDKYNPATKEYADNSYFKQVLNPSVETDEKYINQFLVTGIDSPTSDDHVYFMHKIYGEPEYKSITIGAEYKYDAVYLNKDVLSLVFTNDKNSTVSVVGRASSAITGSENQLVVRFTTGSSGEITKINFEFGYNSADKVVAYENGVWNTNEISSNTTHCNKIYFSNTWTPNNKLINPYFTYLTRSYTAEVKKIANYDDISGGSGGSAELPDGIISFKGLYSNDSTYSKNDLVYHNNHFFICVADSSTNVTPVENMFYTELAGTIYWRNIGYSSEWANKAISDGEGNNIVSTYVAQTTSINDIPLSSNITLKASNIKTEYNDGQDSVEKVLNDMEAGIVQMIEYVDSAVETINNSIGDQVTYTLSGTTLTITPKVVA